MRQVAARVHESQPTEIQRAAGASSCQDGYVLWHPARGRLRLAAGLKPTPINGRAFRALHPP
eukprot:3776998-Pyramimonas_sp.AAC.1